MAETLKSMIADARSVTRALSPADTSQALERGDVRLLIDVREPQEYCEEHAAGAVNVPRGMLELLADPESPATDAALTTERARRIVVYCTKGPGARSLFAARTLTNMGYDNVEVLDGGLVAWGQAGLPVQRGDAAVAS
jgi:rhodanese-related sulfurtransferase